MTSIAVAYWLFLVACWAVTMRAGYRPAIATIGFIFILSIVTSLIYTFGGDTFADVNGYVLVVDILAFLFIVMMMIRVDRDWPIWAAGLQLNALVIHAAMYVDEAVVPGAYAWGSAFWGWIILLVIVIGTWEVKRSRMFTGPHDLETGGRA